MSGWARALAPFHFLREFLTCLFLVGNLCGNAWASPLAEKGVIDLRSVDFSQQGVVNLDGEWEFFPEQLLDPETLAVTGQAASSDYLNFPSAWTGLPREGRVLDGHGVATFRLRVLLARSDSDYALRLFDIRSAYRLWLNGKLISAQGVIAENGGSEVVKQTVDLPVFRSDGTPLELVLEVSNHLYRDGGVLSSIQLGSERAIKTGQARQWGISLFFVGGLLIMGCYHLIFFCLRRQSLATLYFGLYCLLWVGNFMASNSSEWAIHLFFPEVPVEILHRFDSFCFFVSVPVGFMFFRALFPEEFSATVLRISQYLGGAFILIALLMPVRLLLEAVPAYYLISVVLIVYSLVQLIRAFRRKREGAGFILVGFLVLGIIAVNDMLYDLNVIRSVYLIHVGIFFFILSQGFALALTFSRAFASVERLSAELEGRNLELEDEIVERTRLEREIVNVSENERRNLSHDLHDGLCQQLTAARLHCSVLERKQAEGLPGAQELARLSGLLEESVDLAYRLARGLWPVELEAQGMRSFLDDFCQRLAETSGIEIKVHQMRACQNCDNEGMIQMYRIAQEAIGNAVKHARASRIEVTLDCAAPDGVLVLSVRDNGVGRKAASPSSGGLGMRIMVHRARMIDGSLEVCDGEGGGTVVVCRIRCAHCIQNPLVK